MSSATGTLVSGTFTWEGLLFTTADDTVPSEVSGGSEKSFGTALPSII